MGGASVDALSVGFGRTERQQHTRRWLTVGDQPKQETRPRLLAGMRQGDGAFVLTSERASVRSSYEEDTRR